MMKTHLLLGAAIAAFAGGAGAVEVRCAENKTTNAMQCVGPSEVREDARGVRYAPLYTGGPNQIRKTTFTIHTNCKTGITHLKDRDGVSFAGGDGSETPALRDLRAVLCEATPVKSK